ncbi:MAG: hypothetical protein AB7G13_28760 [Lautropia sp.]
MAYKSDLPVYRHAQSEVYALRIESIEGDRLTFEDQNYAPRLVAEEHDGEPEEGGYLVIQKDGRERYVPAEEFTSSYAPAP